MKTLLVDNHDSFTYNLAQMIRAIGGAGATLDIVRNDELELAQAAGYDRIILSPGPGIPREAGQLCAVIEHYAASKPILGICLGHQAIAEVFGATLINAEQVFHGISSALTLNTAHYLFAGLPQQIQAGRYHSWHVDEQHLPATLAVTARDEHGRIMALAHRHHDVQGVQFHPESIMTPQGDVILKNFLAR